MTDNDVKRLTRLTAILTLLQSKRLLTATSLATKFSVSIRTIYRDIKALDQAGVPIVTERRERIFNNGRLQASSYNVH